MLSDKELWAVATYLEQRLGDRAAFFITERMVTLAEQGDDKGVMMWKGVSDRCDQLRARYRGPLPI